MNTFLYVVESIRLKKEKEKLKKQMEGLKLPLREFVNLRFTQNLEQTLKGYGVKQVVTQKILSLLNEDKFKEILGDIFEQIEISKKDVKTNIENKIILSTEASFQDKIRFLETLKEKSLLDFNTLKNGGVGELINIINYDEKEKIKDFLNELSKFLYEIKNFGGTKGRTSQGKGEFFLLFFGKGKIQQGNGDIILNGEATEVKGERGALYTLEKGNPFSTKFHTNLKLYGSISFKKLWEVTNLKDIFGSLDFVLKNYTKSGKENPDRDNLSKFVSDLLSKTISVKENISLQNDFYIIPLKGNAKDIFDNLINKKDKKEFKKEIENLLTNKTIKVFKESEIEANKKLVALQLFHFLLTYRMTGSIKEFTSKYIEDRKDEIMKGDLSLKKFYNEFTPVIVKEAFKEYKKEENFKQLIFLVLGKKQYYYALLETENDLDKNDFSFINKRISGTVFNGSSPVQLVLTIN